MDRTQADPLTIAFIAIGAHTTLLRAQDDLELRHALADAYERHEGQQGLIEAVIAPAPLLDQALEPVSDTFGGVFAYEVAEPFGERFMRALLDQETPDPAPIIADLMAEV